MQALMRMRRVMLRNSSPDEPGSDSIDQNMFTARLIPSITRRKGPGEWRPAHSANGPAARPVSGASTEVTAVAIDRIGLSADAPAMSEGVRRPMARENSPIWGIVIPTLMASEGLRAARIEPTVLAAILPAMNTATTTRAGRM